MDFKVKTKSLIPYFGSDAVIAKDLASIFDRCSNVTIPFIGGASILQHLQAGTIACSDIHGYLINFYQVAKGVFGSEAKQSLIDRCRVTLLHPIDLRHAQSILEESDGYAPDIVAWAFWTLFKVARKGLAGTTHEAKKTSVRRTAACGNNASRFNSAADDLVAWADEFKRCEFESRSFRDQLPKVTDSRGVGVYVEPPWLLEGGIYEHSFNETDHRDLAKQLGRFEQATIGKKQNAGRNRTGIRQRSGSAKNEITWEVWND